jgi:hypothetical protein
MKRYRGRVRRQKKHQISEEEKASESGRRTGTRVQKQKRYQLTEEEKAPESRDRKGTRVQETEKVPVKGANKGTREFGGRKSARVWKKNMC